VEEVIKIFIAGLVGVFTGISSLYLTIKLVSLAIEKLDIKIERI
jgi:hypothetical protein